MFFWLGLSILAWASVPRGRLGRDRKVPFAPRHDSAAGARRFGVGWNHGQARSAISMQSLRLTSVSVSPSIAARRQGWLAGDLAKLLALSWMPWVPWDGACLSRISRSPPPTEDDSGDDSDVCAPANRPACSLSLRLFSSWLIVHAFCRTQPRLPRDGGSDELVQFAATRARVRAGTT
jgi:hypothetical protein